MDAVEIVRSPAANLPIDDAVTDRRRGKTHYVIIFLIHSLPKKQKYEWEPGGW